MTQQTTTDARYAKSRILLLDQYDHVLLFLTRHDVEGYPARWLTAGGHLEAGESHREAAVRELFEETGLLIAEPGPVVWTHHYVAERAPGVWAAHHEEWFAYRTERFTPSATGWTPEELIDIVDQRWWSLSDLERADAPYEPANLVRLLRSQLSAC